MKVFIWPEWKTSLKWSRTEYAETVRPKGHVVWLGLCVFNNKILSSGRVTQDSFEYHWNREYSTALSSTGADHLWKHVLLLWVSTSGSPDLSTSPSTPGLPRAPTSPCPSDAVGVLGSSYPPPCPATGLTQPGPHMGPYPGPAWPILAGPGPARPGPVMASPQPQGGAQGWGAPVPPAALLLVGQQEGPRLQALP